MCKDLKKKELYEAQFVFSFLVCFSKQFCWSIMFVRRTFTQEGCQGCAQTDPAVLHTWLQGMPHLVVVEYVINGDGSKDNQHVFLEYSKKLWAFIT